MLQKCGVGDMHFGNKYVLHIHLRRNRVGWLPADLCVLQQRAWSFDGPCLLPGRGLSMCLWFEWTTGGMH
jgi:hypothetical protein